jgi:hypothetical protein
MLDCFNFLEVLKRVDASTELLAIGHCSPKQRYNMAAAIHLRKADKVDKGFMTFDSAKYWEYYMNWLTLKTLPDFADPASVPPVIAHTPSMETFATAPGSPPLTAAVTSMQSSIGCIDSVSSTMTSKPANKQRILGTATNTVSHAAVSNAALNTDLPSWVGDTPQRKGKYKESHDDSHEGLRHRETLDFRVKLLQRLQVYETLNTEEGKRDSLKSLRNCPSRVVITHEQQVWP